MPAGRLRLTTSRSTSASRTRGTAPVAENAVPSLASTHAGKERRDAAEAVVAVLRRGTRVEQEGGRAAGRGRGDRQAQHRDAGRLAPAPAMEPSNGETRPARALPGVPCPHAGAISPGGAGRHHEHLPFILPLASSARPCADPRPTAVAAVQPPPARHLPDLLDRHHPF